MADVIDDTVNKGWTSFRADDLTTAESAFRQALASSQPGDPRQKDIVSRLLAVYDKLHLSEEQILEKFKNNHDQQVAVANELIERHGQFDPASDKIRQLVGLSAPDKSTQEVHAIGVALDQANALEKMGDQKTAFQAYSAAAGRLKALLATSPPKSAELDALQQRMTEITARMHQIEALEKANRPAATPVSSSTSQPGMQRISGKIVLLEKLENARTFPIKGRQIDGEASLYWYKGGLPGGKNIRADLKLTNKSQYDAFYSAYAAFFDDKGNMQAASGFTQVFALAPGKNGDVHFEMAIPSVNLARVSDFQLVFYDSPQTVGKE